MLITPDWLVISAHEPPRAGHAIHIADGRVNEIGPADDMLAAHPQDEVVDGAGTICAPGFVNAHVHLYGVLAHGIPMTSTPSDFWSFLEDFWWPRVEDSLDHEMIAAATDFVCGEMLRSGTTTFYDILEAPNAIPDALFAQKEVVEQRGLRGVLSFEATERVSADNAQLGLSENRRLIEACRADDGLVSGIMSYHTVFTCSPGFVRQAFEIAGDLGVLTHCHLNEGVHEPEWALANLGMRTVEHYRELGVASDRMLASQCVQLSDIEREILATAGVRVTHMPLSNCEVGGGIAPIPELAAAGVTIGLGSDGYVNDFYEVMRGAFMMHKGRLCDPQVMSALEVFAMATVGGAQALDLENVGTLQPGFSADLQLIDARFPTPLTPDNLLDQVVLWRNGSHVRDVMVSGRWRVRGGELLGADPEAMVARVHENSRRLWGAS